MGNYLLPQMSLYLLQQKISKVQVKSENLDEIEESKERKIYIPRMIHPWKEKAFEEFVKKQKHRLEDIA